MVDNVTADPGASGAVFATDDIGGVHYPITKLTFGALDSQTIASSGNGTTDAGTQRVTLSSDGTGQVIGVGAAAENAAVSGNPVLTGGRYDSSARTLGNGDVGAVALNASGHIIADVSASTGGTHTDDAAFTPGTDDGVPIFAAFDDTTPDSVDEGDAGILRMSANRNLYNTIRDAAGNERGVNVTAGNALTVDGSASTQPVSGTVTANLGATDNAVLDQIEVNTSYGDSVGGGTEAAALRVTLANNSTGVLSVDDNGGSLTVDGTVAATQSGTWNVTNVSGTVSLPTGAATAANQATQTTALQLLDNPIVAHDAAVSGSTGVNMAGARATNSIEGITQVANADATRLQADLNGVLLTRPYTTLEEHISERVSNTNGTSTAFTNFAAGGAGIHNYVTDVTVYNSSATAGYVDIRDGTAGSIIWTFPLPAGGGTTHSFTIPLKGAANTALAYDVSGALSTVYISVNGFQAQG